MKHRMRIGLIAAALLFGVVSSGDDAAAPASHESHLVDLSKYACVQSRRGTQDADLTVVVAISGGGYRSANFALGALLALEHIPGDNRPSLHNEIDYFSTVSGGGLAAAASMASRVHYPASPTPLTDWINREGSLEKMRSNHTARLILSTLRPDNILTRKTRGDDLQIRLEADLLPAGDNAARPSLRRLGDVFKSGDSEVIYPYWFMNSTDMSSGKIIPFTPEGLKREHIRAYWHGNRRVVDQSSDSGYHDVPIAMGLRSSMNFPGAIPPTTLEADTAQRPLHLSDGGLADNIGVVVAVAILNAEDALEDCAGGDRKRLLIIIDAFRGLDQRRKNSLRRPPGTLRSIIRGLKLPLEAHRYRIRQDYSDESAHRLSVLDAMADSDDLGVVYVHLDPKTTPPRTSLHISRRRQHELICAGFLRTLLAFNIPKIESELAIGEYPALCKFGERSGDSEAKILIFGKDRKEDFMHSIVGEVLEAVSETGSRVVNVRSEMGRSVESAIEAYRGKLRGRTMEAVMSLRQENPLPDDKDKWSAFEIDTSDRNSFLEYLRSIERLAEHIRSFTTKPNGTAGRASETDAEEGFLGWLWGLFRQLFSGDPDEGRGNGLPEKLNEWKEVLRILDDVQKFAEDFGCEVDARIGQVDTPVGAEEPCPSSAGLEQTVGLLESAHAELLAKVVQMRVDEGSLEGMANSELYRGLSDFLSLTQVPRRLLSSFVEHQRTFVERRLSEVRVAAGRLKEKVASLSRLDEGAGAVRMEYRKSEVVRGLKKLETLVSKVAGDLAMVDWTIGRSCRALAVGKAEMRKGIRDLESVWTRASDRGAWNVSEEVWRHFRGDHIADLVSKLIEHMKEAIRTMDAAITHWPDTERRDRLDYGDYLEFSFSDYLDLSRGAEDIPYSRAENRGWCKLAEENGAGGSGRED